jgi:hypothetical protein
MKVVLPPHILHIQHIGYIFSGRKGDHLVDFYWIDPMFAAEPIAAQFDFSGKLYLRFEPEESWERPGVCTFGNVNGGHVFEDVQTLEVSPC